MAYKPVFRLFIVYSNIMQPYSYTFYFMILTTGNYDHVRQLQKRVFFKTMRSLDCEIFIKVIAKQACFSANISIKFIVKHNGADKLFYNQFSNTFLTTPNFRKNNKINSGIKKRNFGRISSYTNFYLFTKCIIDGIRKRIAF